MGKQDLISKEEAVTMLEGLKKEYDREQLVMRAGVVGKVIRLLTEMKPLALVNCRTENAQVETQVEPWFEGGATGRDVKRCGACAQRLDSMDIYCRHCGRRLIRMEGKGHGGRKAV
ncbi:MAG: hypothetical protein J5556_07095 [Deltaproteobacteria bacterium]|nr:hypothetical protein [Deltaproteobacteria bacterium]